MDESCSVQSNEATRKCKIESEDDPFTIILHFGFSESTGYSYSQSLDSNSTYVVLCSHNITSLPAEIGLFGQLKNLSLNKNYLTSLPAEIGLLGRLKHLNLNHNQLASLPPEICQLSGLEELELGYNQFTSIPEEIVKLSALKELSLRNNRLTSMSAEIGKLSKLEVILFESNEIKSLPTEIGKMRSLKQLYLNHNQLTSLPVEIGGLSALKTLLVWGNPVQNSFLDVVNGGHINYIRKLFFKQLSWTEQNHYFYSEKIKVIIFTILVIASVQNGTPRHPEAQFYKLPKEILYVIFDFICT